MCTLSVIVRDTAYSIAMNRDERIARGAGTAAEVHVSDGIKAIYPGDGTGGTWIGINQFGISLAILNWNDVVPRRVDPNAARSRGRVIPALIATRSLSELCAALAVLDLEGMSPFILVGMFPGEGKISEWRWNSAKLGSRELLWESRHWFSSSLSDVEAHRVRSEICASAGREPDAGSLPWLRRLHATHASNRGPFDVCVHRAEVETLSYTELDCTPQVVQCRHFVGSPCKMTAPDVLIEMQRAGGLILPVEGVDKAAV